MALPLPGPVVLIIDDEAAVRDTLRLILEQDYEVLEAFDGPSALAVAGVAPVDLVLLDIRLPGVDGLELLPQLLAARPGVPVIVVSGVDRAETAATAIRLGAVNYLTKPFDIDVLLDAVNAALRRKWRGRAAPPRQAPSIVALIGCSTRIVAGLGATLMGTINVQSHGDPPPAEVLAEQGAPAVIVVDTHNRPVEWLDRAALMIARFPSTTRPVMLIDPTSSVEARFVLGQRCLALERPWQLATLLDLVCDALPEAPVRRPWRDQRAAAVIEAVASDYAHFNLNRMADQLGLHPYYLSRWFRRQAGVALTSYLIRVRLHAARHLLEQGHTKMDHLAPEVGFYDASHLSRSFLEVFGRRPGQRRLATPRDR